MNRNPLHRRDFMKTALLSGAAAGVLGSNAVAQAPDPPPPQKVPRKTLGNTGVTVPILTIGGGRGFDRQYDKRLHRALALGIDYIDTALHYANGQSHKSLAVFLKQIDRKQVGITSKVSLHGSRGTPEAFAARFDECLATLEIDRLEMFAMHAVGPGDENLISKEMVQMAEGLKKSGKTRLFGFSCHGGNVPDIMNRAAALGGGIDAIMFRYNFREYGDLELNKAIDACKTAGIGLIAMKAFAAIPDDDEKAAGFVSKDFTLAQAKLKAVWADERIDSICAQMQSVEQVEENAAAAMSPAQLSMNDFVQLNRLAACTAPLYCKGCSHRCESRVNAPLRIADTLRHLMYHESYGEHRRARDWYRALSDAERNYEAVDLSAAAAACPQGIDLAARLRHARHVLSA